MKQLRPGSAEAQQLEKAITQICVIERVSERRVKMKRLRAYIRLNYTGSYAELLSKKLRRT